MDPLKPFGTLIRSVWDKSVRRSERRENSVSTTSADTSRASGVAESSALNPVQSRLRARVSALAVWDEAQARELFVETVLLSELGNDLERDPAFAAMVRNIGRQLATDPALSRRLDVLLKELAQEPTEG